jgi:hypothetical protein
MADEEGATSGVKEGHSAGEGVEAAGKEADAVVVGYRGDGAVLR